jgi:hypothetical protein
MLAKPAKKGLKRLEGLIAGIEVALPALADSQEPLRAVSYCAGREVPGVKARFGSVGAGVLVVTDRNLYFAGVNDGVNFQCALGDIDNVRWAETPRVPKPFAGRRGRLMFEVPSGVLHLIMVEVEAGELLQSLGAGLVPSAADAIASFGPLRLFPDRLVTPERVFLLEPGASAEVQTAGELTATRGRNIAAGLAGTAVFGPLGMLLGAAETRVYDHRELYLLVTGASWAYGINVNPNDGLAIRRFGQEINIAAGKLASDESKQEGRLDQLQKLGELKAAGVLTDAEFGAEKQPILGD